MKYEYTLKLNDYLNVTLPPIILYAGAPRMIASRAKGREQLGHTQGIVVKS